jgi:hypothetical protein
VSKAFIDTTILVDILLKTGKPHESAKNALARYSITELPVYAIKEFKAGALKNFIWMHNKLVDERSLSKALIALQKMFMKPYLTSTSIEALSQASGSMSLSLGALKEKYGADADPDVAICEEWRLLIQAKILKAWKRRRNVTTNISHPLKCYSEESPKIVRKLIEIDPIKCEKGNDCCMKERLVSAPEELKKLYNAVQAQPTKPENKRRSKVLDELINKPKNPMTDVMCRNLGDAIFAFLAPLDSKILTTNRNDHEPLASSLLKQVDSP